MPFPKINDPQFKAKWVAALRSGDYPQDSCTLRTSNGFCCLGVAQDILTKEDPSKFGVWERVSRTVEGNEVGVDWCWVKEPQDISELTETVDVLPEVSATHLGLVGRTGFANTNLAFDAVTPEEREDLVNFVLVKMAEANQGVTFTLKTTFQVPTQIPNMPAAIDITTLNDEGVPFSIIADVIEKYL